MAQYWIRTPKGAYLDLSKAYYITVKPFYESKDVVHWNVCAIFGYQQDEFRYETELFVDENFNTEEEAKKCLEHHIRGLNGLEQNENL